MKKGTGGRTRGEKRKDGKGQRRKEEGWIGEREMEERWKMNRRGGKEERGKGGKGKVEK